jgi:acyl carrier protein
MIEGVRLMSVHSAGPFDVVSLRPRMEQVVSRISRIDASEFRDEVLIREELGIDSLMSMEILATIEKELGLILDEGLFACVETVGEFFALVERNYREQKAAGY